MGVCVCLWETPGDLWPDLAVYIYKYPIPGYSLATLNTLLGTVSGEVNAAERARPVCEVLFVGATLHSDPWVR